MDIRSYALHFEARKVSIAQDKNGIMLKLSIHPNDCPPDMFTTPLGMRYMVAMVPIGDDEQPVPSHHKEDVRKIISSAILLPKNEVFQQWMHDNGYADKVSEDAAIYGIYAACGINSRSEFADNEHARQEFKQLRSDFRSYMEGRLPVRGVGHDQ